MRAVLATPKSRIICCDAGLMMTVNIIGVECATSPAHALRLSDDGLRFHFGIDISGDKNFGGGSMAMNAVHISPATACRCLPLPSAAAADDEID